MIMKTQLLILGSFIFGASISAYFTKTITEGEILSVLVQNHAAEAKVYTKLKAVVLSQDYDQAVEILSSFENGARLAVKTETAALEENLITRYLHSRSIARVKEYLSSEHIE